MNSTKGQIRQLPLEFYHRPYMGRGTCAKNLPPRGGGGAERRKGADVD